MLQNAACGLRTGESTTPLPNNHYHLTASGRTRPNYILPHSRPRKPTRTTIDLPTNKSLQRVQQIYVQRRHFRRLLHSSKRTPVRRQRQKLFRDAQRAQERSVREAWCDAVDADALRGELDGEGAGEVRDGGFGGAVIDLEGFGVAGDIGEGEDYAAAARDWEDGESDRA